jgi:hypothetical protein
METCVWLVIVAIAATLIFSLRLVPETLHPAEIWFIWLSAAAVAQHHFNLLETNWGWIGLPKGAKIFWSDELVAVGVVPSLFVWLACVWLHPALGLARKAASTVGWWAVAAGGVLLMERLDFVTLQSGKLMDIYIQAGIYLAEMLLISRIYRHFFVKAGEAA